MWMKCTSNRLKKKKSLWILDITEFHKKNYIHHRCFYTEFINHRMHISTAAKMLLMSWPLEPINDFTIRGPSLIDPRWYNASWQTGWLTTGNDSFMCMICGMNIHALMKHFFFFFLIWWPPYGGNLVVLEDHVPEKSYAIDVFCQRWWLFTVPMVSCAFTTMFFFFFFSLGLLLSSARQLLLCSYMYMYMYSQPMHIFFFFI